VLTGWVEEDDPVNLLLRFSTNSGATEEIENLASTGAFDEVLGIADTPGRLK